MKYNWFHKEQRPRYQPDPFQPQSLYYNKEHDYYVCPMGQHMTKIGVRKGQTESGCVMEVCEENIVKIALDDRFDANLHKGE